MNVGMRVSSQIRFFVFSRYLTKHETARLTILLAFYRISELFSILATPIYIPTNSPGWFLILHNCSSICRLFNDGHSDGCEVVLSL